MFFLMFTACMNSVSSEISGPMLAIGDSFLDYNLDQDASIPDFTGKALQVSIQNNAIGGTRISSGNPEDDIPSQYESGDWSWVLMDGGGNDLNEECGCNSCEENMDGMISADGQTGDIVSLIQDVIEEGAQVAWIGYYEIPAEADEFFNCNDELAVLSQRFSVLADQQDAFIFIDSRSVLSYDSHPQAYSEDLVHPSTEGSRIIGEYVAAQILAVSE